MPLNPPSAIDRRGKTPERNENGMFVTMFPQGEMPEPEPGLAPDEITDLAAPNPGRTLTQLTWTPIMNADRIESYVRNDDAGGSFNLVSDLVHGLTESTPLSLLLPNTTYSAYLVAVNEFGTTQSNAVTFTTRSLLGL